jgi:hypothetical protein
VGTVLTGDGVVNGAGDGARLGPLARGAGFVSPGLLYGVEYLAVSGLFGSGLGDDANGSLAGDVADEVLVEDGNVLVEDCGLLRPPISAAPDPNRFGGIDGGG